ncbi:MAG: MBL fold metallo-hydrolase [Spirochaetaceae bacterium]|nr:MAG: MBL fold metallo-hydrolase [Spirochaetaceae bacterium]
MFLRQIYDDALAQAAYMVGCQKSGEALVIDPERDIDRYHELAAAHGLKIVAVAETHIHADFVSGAQEFAADPNVTIYLSSLGGEDWSYHWPTSEHRVHSLKDGDRFMIGNVEIQAIHSPGHTPEHMSYLIIDRGSGADQPVAIGTGDFLFVGDVGRPDLLESAAGVAGAMEPSARTLQGSLAQRLANLPDFVQVLPGHGAGSACGKALGALPSSTVGYERLYNGALRLAQNDAQGFVQEILAGQPEPPLYFKRMKHVNRDGITVTGGVPECAQLDPSALKSIVGRDGVQVLDARADRAAFERTHLQGSVCAPLAGGSLVNSAGSFLTGEEEIVLVVDNPVHVDEAVRQLYRIGFDRFAGWVTWADAQSSGLPVQPQEVIEFDQYAPETLPAGTRILDVRTVTEHNEGHLPHAIHIPYTRLRDRLSELSTDVPYAVYCASGRRASLSASFLRSIGYRVVLLNGDGSNHFARSAA